MFTLEDGPPPCICLHVDLDLICRSHQAQEISQRGCDHYENDPAGPQLVDLMAFFQLLWQTTGTLHRCEMYDRPYNKLDIGQLPQIAVVDSFYHGLVCEGP